MNPKCPTHQGMIKNVSSTLGTGPIRQMKASELVAATLRRQIISGRLKEGSLLPPESVLLEELNVSRPTLREAYSVLESEGLIRVQRGGRGGARVLPPSREIAANYTGLLLQYLSVPVADVCERGPCWRSQPLSA